MKIFRNEVFEGSPLERAWEGAFVKIEKDKYGLYLYVGDISVCCLYFKLFYGFPESEIERVISQIYNDLNEIKYEDEGYKVCWGREFGRLNSGNVICRADPPFSSGEDIYDYRLFINGVETHFSSSDDKNDIVYLINVAKKIQKCCLMFSLNDPSLFVRNS